MAKREAQAHAIPPEAAAPTAIDRAEQALVERINAFTEASEALRAEIRAFESAMAAAEGRSPAPMLRLVVSRETAEMEAIDEAIEAERNAEAVGEIESAAAERPTPGQIAEFLRVHEEREEAAPGAPALPPPAETRTRPRNLARERLYADLGGAAIGLCGAAAVINFVLLK